MLPVNKDNKVKFSRALRMQKKSFDMNTFLCWLQRLKKFATSHENATPVERKENLYGGDVGLDGGYGIFIFQLHSLSQNKCKKLKTYS